LDGTGLNQGEFSSQKLKCKNLHFTLKRNHPNRMTLPSSSFGVFSFSSDKYNSHPPVPQTTKRIESYLFPFQLKFGQKNHQQNSFQVLIAGLYFSLSYLAQIVPCRSTGPV